MRFVLAVVALVIAIGLAGYGVAQRTVLNGPDRLTAEVESTSDATVTVIGGETLNSLEGRQSVSIGGSPAIFAAYGRTDDVLAWVGDTAYNRIEFDAETLDLVSATEAGADTEVPDPTGSDLWLREYTGENSLDMPVVLGQDLSILVVSDGTEPAPSTISISWPVDNRTPWAGPLVAAGAAVLLLSLLFFFWALIHQRRMHGPRRKSIRSARPPRMPKLPRQRSYRGPKPKAVTSSKGRRSVRRMIATVPVIVAGSLVVTGCSTGIPTFAGANSPSPSPTDLEQAAAEQVQPPAATVSQVESIVRKVAKVATDSDAALDGEGLKARFAGPALALRQGNYAIRAKDSAYQAVPALPSTDANAIEVSLPQKLPLEGEGWPRSIFVVVNDPTVEGAVPIALMLVQETPRDQYKANFAVPLSGQVDPPPLPPEGVGATVVRPDSKLVSLPPGQVLTSYLDVVNLGSASAAYGLFDIENDALLPLIGVEARAERKAKSSAAIEYSIAAAPDDPIALASDESGALVAVYMTETEVARPAETGASINPEGGTKTLSGVTGSTKGVTASFGDQMLFYIPPVTKADAKIQLLGFSQGLISAQELP